MMLSEAQLATVRAALQFWRDEVCPFGEAAASPYMDVPVERHLSSRQVHALQQLFASSGVRYAPYDPETQRIAAPFLVSDREAAWRLTRSGLAVGTVILG